MSEIETRLVPGPLAKTVTTYHCDGCPALHTKDWSFMGENDDLDSGTDARCTEADKHIESYWHPGHRAPRWCPALSNPAPGHGEGGL